MTKQHLELWFVLEVPEGERRSKIYIVQPSERQFYRAQNLHVCHHYQLCGCDAVSSFIMSIERDGLSYIPASEVTSRSSSFFTLVTSEENYVLPDITVVNKFSNTARLLSNTMRLERIASQFLNNQCHVTHSDSRNNIRADIGFCSQAHNDPTVVPGMVAPRYTTFLDKISGIDDDETLTKTLIIESTKLKKVVDVIKDDLDVEWNDFPDDIRSHMFCRRIAQRHGVSDDDDFVTEGCSFGLTGMMPNGDYKKLNRHLDTQNSMDEGFNSYWGYALYVPVRYPGWKSEVWIRVSFGGYGKKCVADFMRRFRVNNEVLSQVLTWMDNNPDVIDIDHRILTFRTSAPFKHIRPHANKFVYYSIYVHGCLELGRMYGFDKAFLFEAVYAMSLCPSPSGWYQGIMAAAESRNGGNLITSFIEYMVRVHGSVSAGQFRRRQPSHNRTMLRRMPFWSCSNMNRTITPHGEGHDIRRQLSRSAADGGVHGAGELIAQEQMTVVEMAGTVGNDSIVDSVVIGANTQTATRLQGMGVRSAENRAELLNFISASIREGTMYSENLMCEVGRDGATSAFHAYDTLARGQPIYEEVLGMLFRMDDTGFTEHMGTIPWEFGLAMYNDDAIFWWDEDIDFMDIEGEFVLSRN